MNIGQHMHHCCRKHGCKYGDHDCPVADGSSEQKFPCDLCNDEGVAKDILTSASQTIHDKPQTELERLYGLFQRISGLGRVCADFENCEHPACDDSYLAKMIADEALSKKGE